MKISKEELFSVGSELKLSKDQLEALWKGLGRLEQGFGTTPFTKFLFYLGAMIAISAMTWFMSVGWESFGGGGIFLIAVAYAMIFTLLARLLWHKKGARLPAGLLITMAVCMAPLAIYGLQDYFHFLPVEGKETYTDFYALIEGRWVWIELGTILAGVIALRFFPFPFLMAPIFFAAWYLTMDIVPFLFGKEADFKTQSWISLFLGLVMLAIGYVIDRKKQGDYAFWSYLFGTLSFWGGLGGLVWDRGEAVLFLYLLINLLMMCFSIFLKQNVLMIFGAIGLFAYLGHLAYNLFQDSILFPFALSFIGLLIIGLGIWYQKNLEWIKSKIR